MNKWAGVLMAATLLWVTPPSVGQDVLEQPVDPRETLRDLDEQVMDKQKALFAARLRGDPEELRRAEEEFRQLQEKRGKTVRQIERVR